MNDHHATCIYCGSETAVIYSFELGPEYDGKKYSCILKSVTCDDCGEEFIPTSIILENELALAAYKQQWTDDGYTNPMSYMVWRDKV